ncbi:MAG: DNA-3-methyladenine glycosylase [Actinomycetota bacterium]|nr:DNA-3-methyladenine glycosylase [Actinomycetota bacterium]
MVDLTQAAHVVAPQLLGAYLSSEAGGARVVVRITEVEAYAGVGVDPGSHAFRGQTPRTAVMFGLPGHAYVYFTYGMHWCFNIVTGEVGEAGAVLVRAGAITEGLEHARARRSAARTDRELARGPARLTKALGIDGSLNGADLLTSTGSLQLRTPAIIADEFRVSARTGVGGAGALTPWRFFLPDEPTVSRHVPARQLAKR